MSDVCVCATKMGRKKLFSYKANGRFLRLPRVSEPNDPINLFSYYYIGESWHLKQNLKPRKWTIIPN